MTFKRLIIIIGIILLSTNLYAQDKKPFTYEDAMKFERLRGDIISFDGKWLGYYTEPDRGNPTGYLRSTENDTEYIIERGTNPEIARNSLWAAFRVEPDVIEAANAKRGEGPKNAMALINTLNGEQTHIKEVKSYEFSNDSKWLAFFKFTDNSSSNDKSVGDDLVLRHLNSGTEILINEVSEFIFDSTATYLFYTISGSEGDRDGVYGRNLTETFAPEFIIESDTNKYFGKLAWNKHEDVLAYLFGELDDDGKADECELKIWNAQDNSIKAIMDSTNIPENWFIPYKNSMEWTEDGDRLFFGIKPVAEKYDTEEEEIKYSEDNYFNIDTILAQTDLKLWHYDDERIYPNQEINWKQAKDHTYKSVYHLDDNRFVQLADSICPNVDPTDNPDFALGMNERPYLKLITWEGWFYDVYSVNINTGEKNIVTKKYQAPYRNQVHISPDGNFVLYFIDKDWYLYNNHDKSSKNLTELMDIAFYDEKWDVPAPPPGYGEAGWFEGDSAVMIYDRYDIWKFNTFTDGQPENITKIGRDNQLRFKIYNLDDKKKFFTSQDSVFLWTFHDWEKYLAVYKMNFVSGSVPEQVIQDNKRFTIHSKAENSDEIIYTRESYEEFPDIWVTNMNWEAPKKITHVNPQLSEFNWGTNELVQWQTPNGDTLQGYILKPDDYDPNKKYPLFIYFYEQFSDRMYRFVQPYINHRPTYPVYTGSGYLIFFPDIKYYTGRPGFDALDALLSGARMLGQKGIIDTNRVVIQGHSWGAYEAAFIVTQTDFFKAACAGAPVGNMTSAYSGIRLGSGLARQFQYEKYQSRIGGNLWDSLDSYLRNSPVMQAETMNTPLLIMHGDVDDAVPFEQSIELYLAMRRLNKNCIFLHYPNEPHWPGRYPNKLDYAVKMKQFFDHYIFNEPAPEWMIKGIPYRGK